MGWRVDVTQNKKTVDKYMDGFGRSDREQILSCLTDDVEWEIPGVFHVRGKEGFARHIVDEGFVGTPASESVSLSRAPGRSSFRQDAPTWKIRVVRLETLYQAGNTELRKVAGEK